MKAREIVDKIFKDRARINPYWDSKCWFEISVCEKRSDKYHEWDSQSILKYNKLDVKDNKILFLNRKGKLIKELSKENTVWLNKVYLCDNHIKVLISDLNYVEIN